MIIVVGTVLEDTLMGLIYLELCVVPGCTITTLESTITPYTTTNVRLANLAPNFISDMFSISYSNREPDADMYDEVAAACFA